MVAPAALHLRALFRRMGLSSGNMVPTLLWRIRGPGGTLRTLFGLVCYPLQYDCHATISLLGYSWKSADEDPFVEQPVGTGFSQGTPTATSETDVASQFLGFFKNFVDTFAMQGYTVYISGESYAGYYVPYIADAMHNKNDKEYYNISSILIYDPSLSSNAIQEQIPAVPFVDFWGPLIDLNASFLADIHKRADSCNYTSYLNEYLVFPPKGPLPTPPNVHGNVHGCDLWDDILAAATWVNPCFDIYQVSQPGVPLSLADIGTRSQRHALSYGTFSASLAPSPTPPQARMCTSTALTSKPRSTRRRPTGWNARAQTSSSTALTIRLPPA